MFKKYNITTFCAPPTIYRFFIKEDLSKLRPVVADAMRPPQARRSIPRYSTSFYEVDRASS